MRAHFGLPSVTAEDTEGKPPIQVKFEIPYFTTSGIQVYLVHKLNGYIYGIKILNRYNMHFMDYENVFL